MARAARQTTPANRTAYHRGPFQPCQRAVDGEVVRIYAFVSLLRPDLALSSFLEQRSYIIIAGIVVAKVVIPISLLHSIVRMHLADDGYFIAGLAQEVCDCLLYTSDAA